MNAGAMAGPAKLSILILNWNRAADTTELLLNLAESAHSEGVSAFEVVILDNGSDEVAPDWCGLTDLEVKFDRSETNLGYSGGMRRLMQLSTAGYLWFLNNDARLDPGALSIALELAREEREGVNLPIVLDPDGTMQSRDCHWNAVLGWRSERLPLSTGGSPYRLFGDIFVGPLMSRAVCERIGAFPPQFHTYGEDFDACYAAAMMRIDVMRIPSLVLRHAKSSSKPKDKISRFDFDRQAVRNVLASALTNYRPSGFWAVFLLGLKLMGHELVWRRRIPSQASAWWSWATIPRDAVRLSRDLGNLRSHRNKNRTRSDAEIWALRSTVSN